MIDKADIIYTKSWMNLAETSYDSNSDDGSIPDTAFGIIVGCIYSSFLQTYTNQNSTPNSQDMEEFTKIIIKNSKKIKESIMTDDTKN